MVIRKSVLAETVYVMSRGGKVLAQFDLDTSLRAFAVDEKQKTIYGISTDEEPSITTFEMPSKFKKLL